jgi:predicted RNase H-like HicB family nuclease
MEDYVMKFRTFIEQDEDGIFVATCPTLPGCISQGNTRQEALLNLKDAIEGYLYSLQKHNEPIPLPISEELLEIVI